MCWRCFITTTELKLGRCPRSFRRAIPQSQDDRRDRFLDESLAWLPASFRQLIDSGMRVGWWWIPRPCRFHLALQKETSNSISVSVSSLSHWNSLVCNEKEGSTPIKMHRPTVKLLDDVRRNGPKFMLPSVRKSHSNGPSLKKLLVASESRVSGVPHHGRCGTAVLGSVTWEIPCWNYCPGLISQSLGWPGLNHPLFPSPLQLFRTLLPNLWNKLFISWRALTFEKLSLPWCVCLPPDYFIHDFQVMVIPIELPAKTVSPGTVTGLGSFGSASTSTPSGISLGHIY